MCALLDSIHPTRDLLPYRLLQAGRGKKRKPPEGGNLCRLGRFLEVDGVLAHECFDLGDQVVVAGGLPMTRQDPDQVGVGGDDGDGETLALERGQRLTDGFQHRLILGCSH